MNDQANRSALFVSQMKVVIEAISAAQNHAGSDDSARMLRRAAIAAIDKLRELASNPVEERLADERMKEDRIVKWRSAL